jgi:DNA-binding LytR/AlgR family response regulator
MYSCIIVDDEQDSIEGLKKYMESFSELDLVATYLDPVEAFKAILAGPTVDFVFLDIDMPKISGIELAKEIRGKVRQLIFTTAHSKYAYEAFEVNAEGYLLKPYTLSKFMTTVSKLIGIEKTDIKVIKEDFFFVKSKEDHLKIIKIKFNDLIAIESKQNYVMLYLKNKNVLTYMSLTEIMKFLKDIPGFIQLHRSFIIQQDEIQSIDGNQIKLTNELQITIGETFRKEFNTFVQERLIKAGKRG